MGKQEDFKLQDLNLTVPNFQNVGVAPLKDLSTAFADYNQAQYDAQYPSVFNQDNLPTLERPTYLDINSNRLNMSLDDRLKEATINEIEASQKHADAVTAKLNDDSWTVGDTAKVAGALSSLFSIYSGWEQLGAAKDTLAIAKEKWNTTKAELARVQGVRNKLTSNYVS